MGRRVGDREESSRVDERIENLGGEVDGSVRIWIARWNGMVYQSGGGRKVDDRGEGSRVDYRVEKANGKVDGSDDVDGKVERVGISGWKRWKRRRQRRQQQGG